VHTLADACGLVLDEVVFEGDVWISPETYIPVNGLTVEAGTVGAIRFSLSGVVNGQRPRHGMAPSRDRVLV
jgi:hypothetical protein